MDLSVLELQRGDDQAKEHHKRLSVRLAILILIGHNIQLTFCSWMSAANLVHALVKLCCKCPTDVTQLSTKSH